MVANAFGSAAGMNWTAVVYGGLMIVVTIWWLVSAHKWFRGPKVNVEHMMLDRREVAVVEGQAPPSNRGHGSLSSDTKTWEKKNLPC